MNECVWIVGRTGLIMRSLLDLDISRVCLSRHHPHNNCTLHFAKMGKENELVLFGGDK
jgi:hypothetical protein